MARNFGGMPGMPGGGNMQQLMKQAQKMQRQMADMQSSLDEKEFEVTAGGGAIKIVINGKKELKSIEIDKDVIDPDDAEMLQDLILSAVNESIRKADEAVNGEMSKITGGMNLPGMF
jgi:DNA-binding YbaB/EbfC family protein